MAFLQKYRRLPNLRASITFLFAALFFLSCQNQTAETTDKPWSLRMAESVIARNPEPWMIDFRETPKWEYTQGLVLKSLMEVWRSTGDDKYLSYVRSYYDQFVDDDGNIDLYRLEDYNIDRINPGKVLFPLLRKTGEEKFKAAILLLRKQMMNHPRTKEGGFWHKKIYPYQMWLDGLYMGAPFLAEFAQSFDEMELFDDIANQFVWMDAHARDDKTGLLYHGWDESREQRWADPETGLSPHFWGRGMGWFAMALVDVLDYWPEDHPRRMTIINILSNLAPALARYQDTETGVWYQVVDRGGSPGNYLESSASCMFVYALAKAAKKRYIPEKFLGVAQRGYQGILDQFIEVDEAGLVNLHQACAVAGLGGDPYRDGSYEYYISTEIRSNDPKAVGPFILASLELESIE